MYFYYIQCDLIKKWSLTSVSRETHLRFDLPLRLAHEAICPLFQFTRGRLINLDVSILVTPELFGYILHDSSRKQIKGFLAAIGKIKMTTKKVKCMEKFKSSAQTHHARWETTEKLNIDLKNWHFSCSVIIHQLDPPRPTCHATTFTLPEWLFIIIQQSEVCGVLQSFLL